MPHSETMPEDLTSIVIPAHNCVEMTRDCLLSIRRHTRIPYEILLIDDASSPPLSEALADLDMPNLRILRNEERRSFSANNNLGAREARGRYLCLLNNDTLVTPAWLDPMVRLLRESPDIGVLANKHLFPKTGRLHHCGMAFDGDGFPIHLHPHTDPAAPSVNMQRDFQIVTFACVVIPAEVYRRLNGLDEAYRNGFEDCDFCLRVRQSGLRVVYTPASVIIHFGQSTPGRKDHDNANWNTFRERWGGKVELDLKPLTEADRRHNRAISRRRAMKRPPGIHFAVDFSQGSAFTWASVEIIRALLAAGEAVSIPRASILDAHIAPEDRRWLKGLMRRAPCASSHLKWSHYWPSCMRQALAGDVNAEFFCTNYRYRPDAKWLDLWMRHVQVNGYRKLPVAGFNLDALADIGVSASQCAIVPLGYSPQIDTLFPEGRPPREEGRDLHLLLVTNSHDLYRYGTDIAIEALSRAFGPDDPVVVHIKDYGAVDGASPQLEQWIAERKRFPRIEWHREFVGKEDLLRLYAQSDALLAPYRGEGFSMKIADAMALGVPVLMPSFGGPLEFAAPSGYVPIAHREVEVGRCYDAEQFYLGEGAYWCEADTDDLAARLIDLKERRADVVGIGEKARAHVRARYTWARAAERLIEALRGWGADREVTVSRRRHAPERPLTVLIPTKDRSDILDKALDAYAVQSLPAKEFEIVIVNDHGRREELDPVVARHEARLSLRVFDNPGPGGPAAARNHGIEKARGNIVLITGDDIVPHRDFLREHLNGHQRFPRLEAAMVGLTLWHPDVPLTPFNHIIASPGKRGWQFNYEGMKNHRRAPFSRFYTSNCSLKRDFLIEREEMFSTAYPYAAFEDTEMAYRLHLHGMDLRYLEHAIGYHHHEMTPASFVRRQNRVGRMLTLLALQRPCFVPDEHTAFLRALEFYRSWPSAFESFPASVESLPDTLLAAFESMLEVESDLARECGRPIVEGDRRAWRAWFAGAGDAMWESINEMVLRMGMAEQWAEGQDEDFIRKAVRWIALGDVPRVVSPSALFWRYPGVVPALPAALFPRSKLAYRLSLLLRNTPGVGTLMARTAQSRFGQGLRRVLLRIMARS